MARAFRYQPPSVPDGLVDRPRLLDRLARRRDRRLVTVVAGAGFGKTALLVSAMRATPSEGDSQGTDIWLACEAADEDGAHLEQGLVTAMGLPSDTDLAALCDAVWAKAPDPVCLVLDDVHEVPASSTGAVVLRRLVDDLPANGHVVLASREPVPLAVARLAASQQLERVEESDLLLTDEELTTFAGLRGLDPASLQETGGWPALAELTASAGGALLVEYLWEEVLERLPEDRATMLARLSVVGGGDDEVVSALAGRPTSTAEVVAGLPLVQRPGGGGDARVALHPLWGPPLRRYLDPADADGARRAAADVHRRNGRAATAVELLADAEDWDAVLAVVRDVACGAPVESPAPFGRWVELLPARVRDEPAARMAAALDVRPRDPIGSIAGFAAAVAGFRAAGDEVAEVAALGHLGSALWLRGDLGGLLDVKLRVDELADRGVAAAEALRPIGDAGMAHLSGDPAGVLAAVHAAERDPSLLEGTIWPQTLIWFSSVAHRRLGDLPRAIAVLGSDGDSAWERRPDAWFARLRAGWLAGDVDEVVAELSPLLDVLRGSGDEFNAAGAWLELVTHRAWLGRGDDEAGLVRAAPTQLEGAGGAMGDVMVCIARAATALGEGDEARAAALIGPLAESTVGTPDGWYWWDRGALALVHVLAPEIRNRWEHIELGPAHRPVLRLAEALEAARAGDQSVVATLDWPPVGVVRAGLPVPWLVELACAGEAAGNPAPDGLLDAVGYPLRPALRAVADGPAVAAPVAEAARRLLAATPAVPDEPLLVSVLGPLQLRRGGEVVEHPDLRRGRVRELLTFLLIRRRVRREEAIDQLWPELDDRGRNLRVTLSYLQKVLQPDRGEGEPPYFLRTAGGWLVIDGPDRLEVDLWRLYERLDEAAAHERSGDPGAALRVYEEVLPLWRGEPFADVPYVEWAEVERTHVRQRYLSAAVRAGELLLAVGRADAAAHAARRALEADRGSEPAHRLLVRACRSLGDLDGARHAAAACVAALTDLGVEPGPATRALLADEVTA